MRISDWSSDVCSSDLGQRAPVRDRRRVRGVGGADAARYRVATAARGAVVRALRTRADRDLVHRATARPRQRSRAFLIFWSTCVDAAPARAPSPMTLYCLGGGRGRAPLTGFSIAKRSEESRVGTECVSTG